MSNKTTWGGQRPGAGRPPLPKRKDPPQYVMIRIAQPETPAEIAAVEWYKTLSPATRLESIVEDHTFQPGYAKRVA